MIRLVDDSGREVRLQAAATRVVSLVPSLTESICVLGARERLVAVTRHCTRPAAGLEQVARVGGTKNPDVAAIVALRPDLVIVKSEENRREDFDALVDGGLTILVTHPRRVSDVPAMLRVVGQVVGADAAAAEKAAALASTSSANVGSATSRSHSMRSSPSGRK